jgi:hypothetical protein
VEKVKAKAEKIKVSSAMLPVRLLLERLAS